MSFFRCLALLAALFAAPAHAQVVLAPGKSVVVVDAADQTVQVVLTASSDEPLDLTAFFNSVDPKDGVLGLATRRHVSAAATLVQATDGSLALGPKPPAPISAAAMAIESGIVALHQGQFVLLNAVRAAAPAGSVGR